MKFVYKYLLSNGNKVWTDVGTMNGRTDGRMDRLTDGRSENIIEIKELSAAISLGSLRIKVESQTLLQSQ